MTEEFLDIIDEDNELTGESASRSRIHAEGLWHRTVHIFVFRKRNNQIEFLIHLRSPFKDSSPDKWGTSVGGHIKVGASFEEAARSELQEEIGLDVDSEKLFGGYWRKRDRNPNREFTINYCLEYAGKTEELTFNDGEVQEVKWMTVSEIENAMQKNPDRWAGKGTGLMDATDYLKEKIS